MNRKELKSFLENAPWYHSISFPYGLRSNGVYDPGKHIDSYGFSESLKNKEILDVGCSDGFFSFEFERRGAKRVLAVDTNKFDGNVAISPSPSRKDEYERKYKSNYLKNRVFIGFAKKIGLSEVNNFLIAKKILNSSVEYKDCSIYNLDSLNQSFNLVFCGDLIEHLKNPIEAVEKLCLVTRELCIISLSSVTKIPLWLFPVKFSRLLNNKIVTYWGDSGGSFFHFSESAFKKLILASGFSRVDIISRFKMKDSRTGELNPHVVYHCYK